MPDPATAWLFGLATMLTVFLIIYYKENKLRLALIYALLWGKILATVFMLLHLDIPLATIYTYRPETGLVPQATITANMLVFLSFLFTNLVAITWPEIRKELGITSDFV